MIHKHYGRENTVRNNIFAFGRQGQVEITRIEDHVSFTFERNIMVSDGAPAIMGRAGTSNVEDFRMVCDLNLYWDVSGEPSAPAGDARRDAEAGWSLAQTVLTSDWHRLGHDRHSVLADPRLTDLAARRLELSADSPARDLDISAPAALEAGIRPREERARS
ncbi:hypothetical protein [Actinopolymorpha pittospori]